MEIKIKKEYENLVPPLPEKDYNELKESIRKDGLYYEIIVNKDGYVLDGHNRVKICRELGIEISFWIKDDFENESQEKLFVINTNLKRRHMNTFQRIETALKKKPIYEEMARSNMSLAGKGDRILTPLGRIDELIAIDAGTSRDTVRRVEIILQESDQGHIDEARSGKLSIHQAHSKVEKETKRQALIDESVNVRLPNNCEVYHANFTDPEILKRIPDNSIHLILTDPPYDERSLPLYGSMAGVAVQKLIPGGNLVFYHGKNNLPGIIKALDIPGLKYLWEFCVLHTGGTATVFPKKVFADWKPLLWYVKGEKPDIVDFIHDSVEVELKLESPIVSEPPDKEVQDWEQSIVEAEYIIKKLTVKGMNVLDLMTGAGTTAIACHRLGRQFIGFEIDEKKFKIAKSNIASNTYLG